MLLRVLFVTFLVFFHFQEIFIIVAWPILQVTILNYSHSYAAEYLEYSMVPSIISGAYDINMTVKRSNVKPIVKLGIYFDNVEFMNKTVDVCKVAHSRKEEPLLRLIASVVIDEAARIPRECPLKKGKYHNVLRRIETDKIPPVWPETKTSFYIEIFSKESDRLVPISLQFFQCQFIKADKFNKSLETTSKIYLLMHSSSSCNNTIELIYMQINCR